jgi:hypothetical protein
VIDKVLPGAVLGLLFAFVGGWTLSVTGNAQSGLSAAAAGMGANASTRTQSKLFMPFFPLRLVATCRRKRGHDTLVVVLIEPILRA